MILDLHNNTRYIGRKLLKNTLEKYLNKEKIYIIVGRGLHSNNKKPIMKLFVINYLKSKNIPYIICEKSKGGVIIV